jgi:pimeloyl-ACP methyl ester carboxylesterase
MSTVKRFTFLLISVSLLLTSCNQQPVVPTSTPTPIPAAGTFTNADCPFTTPAGYDVQCGYLSVPENYTKPEGRVISLAVAVFKSYGETPAPDPIVYLEGGPGGSALRGSVDYFQILFDPFLKNRDLILVDQRGTGYSQPALDCGALNQLSIDLLDQDLPVTEVEKQSLEAARTCKEELSKQGVDLDQYNSANNAADLEALRKALGYEKWNLYGISYGTRLALSIMRDYPAGLRSVVIDSVYPPQVSLDTGIAPDAMRSFDAFFSACAADPDCNQAYPDLRQVFFDLVDELNATPARYYLNLPVITGIEQSGERIEVLMDGNTLINFLFQALYATSIIPVLPSLIYDVKDKNYTGVALIQSQLLDSTDDISRGMYFSVQCYEETSFTTVAEVAASLQPFPELGEAFGTPQATFDLCNAWTNKKAPAIENQPVTSDVPTLVMAGALDPITPPAWAQQTASTLSNSYYVEVPNGGHGASLSETCPRNIVIDFFNDPTQKPNTSCLPSKVAFDVPVQSIELELVPVDLNGFSTVIPKNWLEAMSGLYTPTGVVTDQTQIYYQAAAMDMQTLYETLANGLISQGATIAPGPVATRSANGLDWSIYSADVGFITIDMGFAESGGMTYLILLQCSANERDAYMEALFYPAIDAFKLTE